MAIFLTHFTEGLFEKLSYAAGPEHESRIDAAQQMGKSNNPRIRALANTAPTVPARLYPANGGGANPAMLSALGMNFGAPRTPFKRSANAPMNLTTAETGAAMRAGGHPFKRSANALSGPGTRVPRPVSADPAFNALDGAAASPPWRGPLAAAGPASTVRGSRGFAAAASPTVPRAPGAAVARAPVDAKLNNSFDSALAALPSRVPTAIASNSSRGPRNMQMNKD